MTDTTPKTTRITATDAKSGFQSGVHALDDFFSRHALKNEASGVGRTYVLHRADSDPPEIPAVIGFYTLSMAASDSAQLASSVPGLPRYPSPVALIGRLAVDARAKGKGYGGTLLVDALLRSHQAGELLGCVGVIVDAKDAAAEAFYAKHDFATIDDSRWPRRMFTPMAAIRSLVTEA